MTSVPKKELEWLVRTMATLNGFDPDQIVRYVEFKSGFLREYCGPDRNGLMAVQKRYAKAYKLNEKKLKEWRDNVGLGFQILGLLLKHFKGNTFRALVAYHTSIEVVEDALKQGEGKWLDYLDLETKKMLRAIDPEVRIAA